MKRLLRPIGWLTWKAADFTAWLLNLTPEPTNRALDLIQGRAYRLYNVTARFAFWFDERFELGESSLVTWEVEDD